MQEDHTPPTEETETQPYTQRLTATLAQIDHCLTSGLTVSPTAFVTPLRLS